MADTELKDQTTATQPAQAKQAETEAATQAATVINAADHIETVKAAVHNRFNGDVKVMADTAKPNRLWVIDNFIISETHRLMIALAVGGIDPDTFSLKRVGPAVSVTFVK